MVAFWIVWFASEHFGVDWIGGTGWDVAMWALLLTGIIGIGVSLLDYRDQRADRRGHQRSPG
jgi:hypothetical protein